MFWIARLLTGKSAIQLQEQKGLFPPIGLAHRCFARRIRRIRRNGAQLSDIAVLWHRATQRPCDTCPSEARDPSRILCADEYVCPVLRSARKMARSPVW